MVLSLKGCGELHLHALKLSLCFCPLRRLANGLDGVRIENKGRMSTLTFFNVSEKDYGNYTCVAINKLGNTNASIILFGRFLAQGAEHGGLCRIHLGSACEQTVEAFQAEKPLYAQWGFVWDSVPEALLW